MLRLSKDLQDPAFVARDDPAGDAIGDAKDLHSDDEIGQVQGLLVDEDRWAIRCPAVNMGNGWSGHEARAAPQWIVRVSWAERAVSSCAV